MPSFRGHFRPCKTESELPRIPPQPLCAQESTYSECTRLSPTMSKRMLWPGKGFYEYKADINVINVRPAQHVCI